MTDFLLTLGIAAMLAGYAYFSRWQIRRGEDYDQNFVRDTLKPGRLRSFMGSTDYFSKVTLPLATAAFVIAVGTYRIFERG